MNITNYSISAIEIDPSSNYLAIGYTNGSIVIIKLLENKNTSRSIEEQEETNNHFNDNISDDSDDYHIQNDEQFSMELGDDERNDELLLIKGIKKFGLKDKKNKKKIINNSSSSSSNNHEKYQILAYFQAHDTTVIQIQWCKGLCSSLVLLSTSVSNTKLWRINKTENERTKCFLSLKRIFENEDIFNINSISLNSDGQTFLSSDEFRVFLWDLNQNRECYNIVNLKPNNIHFLDEIIKVTEFHPIQCNLFLYGTSKGSLKLCDMRTSALVQGSSKEFTNSNNSDNTIFSSYKDPILDLKFSNDGKYLVSRTLGTLSLWDIRQDSAPLSSINLYHDANLMNKLYDMHEVSYQISDKFQCRFLANNNIITGSYDGKSLIWNPFSNDNSNYIFESPNTVNNYSNNLNNSTSSDFKFYDKYHQEFNSFFPQDNLIDSGDVNLTNEKLNHLFNYIYIYSNHQNFYSQKISKIYQNCNPISISSNGDSNTRKLSINNIVDDKKINIISTSLMSNNDSSSNSDVGKELIVTSSSKHLFIYTS